MGFKGECSYEVDSVQKCKIPNVELEIERKERGGVFAKHKYCSLDQNELSIDWRLMKWELIRVPVIYGNIERDRDSVDGRLFMFLNMKM